MISNCHSTRVVRVKLIPIEKTISKSAFKNRKKYILVMA